MENNYRITFINYNSDKHFSKDVCVRDSDEAFRIAYEMPQAHEYDEVSVEKIPNEPCMIGICFEYEDTYVKRFFRNYIVIRANNEQEAINYYNKNIKGKRFWFNPGKLEENGKCIMGKVIETYFAACPGCDFDAI